MRILSNKLGDMKKKISLIFFFFFLFLFLVICEILGSTWKLIEIAWQFRLFLFFVLFFFYLDMSRSVDVCVVPLVFIFFSFLLSVFLLVVFFCLVVFFLLFLIVSCVCCVCTFACLFFVGLFQRVINDFVFWFFDDRIERRLHAIFRCFFFFKRKWKKRSEK